jgi:Fusaric acid resistance protein family
LPRLAAVSPGADIDAVDLLHDLRAGLNVIGLQRKLPGLPPRAQSRIEATLSDIATHYRGNALNPPPDALLEKIDAAISTLSIAVPSHREALMILSGLRSVLFPGATPPELNPGAGAPDDQRQAA